jgi:hypothetical protein
LSHPHPKWYRVGTAAFHGKSHFFFTGIDENDIFTMMIQSIREKKMNNNFSVEELNAFIIRAKSATYVGNGDKTIPCRMGSHDLKFQEGPFSYLDSYFGGADFIGQEVVYYRDEPVWAMNYYGRIIEKDRITAAEAGQMIKASLSRMYKEGRFLGGFEYFFNEDTYTDTSEGDVTFFTGKEWITRNGVKVYELMYHGGLVIS